ncbi:MAG TPA: glutathione S-transferase family protein [Polyangiaceae bacterium]|jgi:glutathione S-transferase|nr:glutathione S-transferase family protein [Polyangiaceae bacterium]
MNSATMRLFTFDPAWDLPTSGPFGLKLEMCLRLLGVPYERVYENDNRKGPKRKSPWIEDGDAGLGDTECILEHVRRTRGVEIDGTLSPLERARSQILRRMLEEHYHQIFEYELVVLDGGFVHLRKIFEGSMSAPMLTMVGPLIRRGFKKHLFERGVARHTPDEVAAMGRADVDALATWLGEREWFVTDGPTKADASAFGLLAVSIRSPLTTPVCSYARSKPNLVAFVDRALARFFPEHVATAHERTAA